MRLLKAALTAACLSGCYGGSLTTEDLTDHDLSGVAGPADLALAQPVETLPRAQFGQSLDADGLAFPSLSAARREALFDLGDADSPLHFFATPQSAISGLGPMYNQRRCLDCHGNGADNASFGEGTGTEELVRDASPVGRAGRSGPTNRDDVDVARSAAFTVFGDFYPQQGRLDTLSEWGGPVLHEGSADGCFADELPPTVTADARRVVAERAAPSYVGRGLIEAVFAGDIEALADPDDTSSSSSTLAPPPSCTGDCISGRAVLAQDTTEGAAPLLRVGRFGLRATNASLLAVVSAGLQRDVGVTHAFAPDEEQAPRNAGLSCDVAADPELSAEKVLALRDFVRQLAPPELSPDLLRGDDEVERGARLFGVDLAAFRARIGGTVDVEDLGDTQRDHAIAEDRQLNCVGCHTPLWLTGRSPARAGGEHLSNRWVPLFSDLLVHDMGTVPGATVEEREMVLGSHTYFRGIGRDLSDEIQLAPAATPLRGSEWRTAPLLGFGVVGPPYLHDARVFLNPRAPAYFYYGSLSADLDGLDRDARRLEVTDVRTAIQAAIELHDLPQPPDEDLDGTPDYATCPPLEPRLDWCRRDSPFRSEARNTIERWHALSDAEQRSVISFLIAL